MPVFPDYLAEFFKPGRVLVGIDAADWNRRHQAPQDPKLACAQLPVEDFIRISIGYEGEKRILRPDGFHVWCRTWAALVQNINRAKRQAPAFETRALFS